MANEVWKSKDSQIISQYAERLEAEEVPEEEDETDKPDQASPAQRRTTQPDPIDFRYMNSPPSKDLLNYKNMDLEMSLWAKTQHGWLSVGVLLLLATVCFIMTWILWGLHGY